MIVLNGPQMQTVDRITIEEIGIPGAVLMENAGRRVAELVAEKYSTQTTTKALILAGKGNNGGDGFVVARHLMSMGWLVETVILAKRDTISGDAALNLTALENCGGKLHFVQENLLSILTSLSDFNVLVDSLFGTGLCKSIKGIYAEALDWMNNQQIPVVAVDMPSGVDASTGLIHGRAAKAELTVTFALPKVGQITYPGAAYVGELITVDIGIPKIVLARAESQCLAVDIEQARQWLPPRPSDGHKGTFGHLLVLAGSIGKTGAAVMTAEAGLRGGCGLVTLACPESIYSIVASQLTEVMTNPLADVNGEVGMLALDDLIALLKDKKALAVGPGLGLGEEVGTLVRRILMDCSLPTIIDADGLTHLSNHCEILKKRDGQQTVLTPHPGEMSRLTGLSIEEIQSNRVDIARDFASKYGVVVVLKGARTITACPNGQFYINLSGHTGLASGGMGDVLTGLIGSLLAQGMDAGQASALAVYMHGKAADDLRAKFGDCGLLARDLMRRLPATRHILNKES